MLLNSLLKQERSYVHIAKRSLNFVLPSKENKTSTGWQFSISAVQIQIDWWQLLHRKKTDLESVGSDTVLAEPPSEVN